MKRLIAAPDKFRGTLSALEAAEAIAQGVSKVPGWETVQCPMSDGGEGFLDAMASSMHGAFRPARVHGPLGEPVLARWLYCGGTAVIESASACGLTLVGGGSGNDAIEASTRGVGELISAAVGAGCRRILVGIGGTASTDGGSGAIDALEPVSRLKGIEVVVGCDVQTKFTEAALLFSPQKGASPAQAKLLERRLQSLAISYRERFGTDVLNIEGSGAGGGLAGGLAAFGATLTSGFKLVSEAVGLAELISSSSAVITGEGLMDEESFNGKVVGSVAEMANEGRKPVAAIVGASAKEQPQDYEWLKVCNLEDRFGRERAMAEARQLVSECAETIISEMSGVP